jgi:hypothetical protein
MLSVSSSRQSARDTADDSMPVAAARYPTHMWCFSRTALIASFIDRGHYFFPFSERREHKRLRHFLRRVAVAALAHLGVQFPHAGAGRADAAVGSYAVDRLVGIETSH